MSGLFALLVRLYPRPFRERFAAEIVEQLLLGQTQARERGAPAGARFALVAAFDLVTSALAERIRPTWAPARKRTEREKGMGRRVQEWGSDLRLAVRALKRTPGFAAIAAGTLGLAIGAVVGIYSVVDTVLLRPLPYAHVDRLVQILASAPGSDQTGEFGVSSEFFVQYQERSQLIEELAISNSYTNSLRLGDRVERVRMSSPSASLFSTLGATPILGRLPGAGEDVERVAVISHELWRSWFGGDPEVLGRTLDAGGDLRTVIGVLGPEFRFPREDVQIWLPDAIDVAQIRPGRFNLRLVARTKPGVSPEQLAGELTELARGLPERFGGSANYARTIEKHRAVVTPLDQVLLGEVARPLWVLFAATALVLLIACANVANLFLVRAEGRQRDLALRRAIGAGRAQLVRLQMAEALVLALVASALALGLAAAFLPFLLRAAPPGVPRLGDVGLGFGSVTFTVGAALLAALFCGLVPAWRASAPDFARLREGGRGSTGGRRWARAALVAGQTALALLLLIGSGLLMRSFAKLGDVDPGYEIADRLTFQIAPEQEGLKDGPSFARFELDFLDRLAALPGVESVGLIENVPLNESTTPVRVRVEGEGSDGDGGKVVNLTFTAGDYFGTMGIALVDGRGFTTEDHLTTHGNAILSRGAAGRLWPGENPLGQRFQNPIDASLTTVVGVVEDVLQDSFRDAPEAVIYLPLAGATPESWILSSPAYVLKSARAETIAPEVRAIVREIAPEAPMYRVFTMEQLARESMVQLRFTLLVLGIAAALALVLGTVGLYGVLSYVVAQRSREIGVRMALGARAAQVRRMVVGEGTRVVGVGVLIGLGAALASTRALGSLLFGVAPIDAWTFAGMATVMLAVGLVASFLPAWRASRVAPVESLRTE